MIKRFDALQIPHQFLAVILISVLSVVGMLTLALSQSGCQNLCAKTEPARGTAAVLVVDAQTSLTQAAAVIAKIQDPDLKRKAVVALEASLASLRAAEHALHAIVSACTAPNYKTIFADFVKAWTELAPYLQSPLVGGPIGAGSMVPEPLVVQQAR